MVVAPALSPEKPHLSPSSGLRRLPRHVFPVPSQLAISPCTQPSDPMLGCQAFQQSRYTQSSHPSLFSKMLLTRSQKSKRFFTHNLLNPCCFPLGQLAPVKQSLICFLIIFSSLLQVMFVSSIGLQLGRLLCHFSYIGSTLAHFHCIRKLPSLRETERALERHYQRCDEGLCTLLRALLLYELHYFQWNQLNIFSCNFSLSSWEHCHLGSSSVTRPEISSSTHHICPHLYQWLFLFSTLIQLLNILLLICPQHLYEIVLRVPLTYQPSFFPTSCSSRLVLMQSCLVLSYLSSAA